MNDEVYVVLIYIDLWIYVVTHPDLLKDSRNCNKLASRDSLHQISRLTHHQGSQRLPKMTWRQTPKP